MTQVNKVLSDLENDLGVSFSNYEKSILAHDEHFTYIVTFDSSKNELNANVTDLDASNRLGTSYIFEVEFLEYIPAI